MRLQASFTIVENNIFERASWGISVVFDQNWLEGSLGLHSIFFLILFISISGKATAQVAYTEKKAENGTGNIVI
jgi:hypothetical protein